MLCIQSSSLMVGLDDASQSSGSAEWLKAEMRLERGGEAILSISSKVNHFLSRVAHFFLFDVLGFT